MKPSAPIGVKFHAALLGNYDGQTDRPINRQADRHYRERERERERDVSLSLLKKDYDRSMEVKLPALLGNYDRPKEQLKKATLMHVLNFN